MVTGFSFAQSSLPAQIQFNYEVVQQMNIKNGEQSGTNTYYFTTNGDFTAIKSSTGDNGMSMLIYTKDGSGWLVDDARKTITGVSMNKVMTGMAMKGNKNPKTKPARTLTPTGKTKKICGREAVEYQLQSEKGTTNFWYVPVEFPTARLYTAGIGGAGLSKLGATANPLGTAVDKNYLVAEVENGGQKAIETKSITKTAFSFSTAGYTIKDLRGKSLGGIIKEQSK
ncbi:hypothetical protein CLV59_101839 [Chitinophaga dinghuensis]|uniref:DUF4412 domain-containing protein n=2 Tax=Chitinophaga dinghuensis TaxID=1539050 RepID=A0A327WJV4_9BACT|nr:hypothetical protein CLV59_101839 [Chitinophaga dinghuensis]